MRRRSLPSSTFGPKPIPTTCPFDHADLQTDGFCQVGGGYPLGVQRRESCPYCRGDLEWDGGCFRCHGCGTGRREDWSFPGARYDRFTAQGLVIGDGQHWVLTDPTTDRPCTSETETSTRLAAIYRILTSAPTTRWKGMRRG